MARFDQDNEIFSDGGMALGSDQGAQKGREKTPLEEALDAGQLQSNPIPETYTAATDSLHEDNTGNEDRTIDNQPIASPTSAVTATGQINPDTQPASADLINSDGTGGYTGKGASTPDAATPVVYQSPWYGFDQTRSAGGVNDASGSLKYDAQKVLENYNPADVANNAQLQQQILTQLNTLHPGQYELDKDGNFLLSGTADGYIGARPESWAQGTGNWDENSPMVWQWLAYNQAHPGPNGETGTQPTALQSALLNGQGSVAPAVSATDIGGGGTTTTPSSGTNWNQAGMNLLQQLLNNPYSLSDDVVSKMKEAQKETAVGMSGQNLERAQQSIASRGMADSGMTDATNRSYSDQLNSTLLAGNRDIDIKKAAQDKTDIQNALSAWASQQGIQLDQAKLSEMANEFSRSLANDQSKWLDEMAYRWGALGAGYADSYQSSLTK